jgi:hypothetical protein
MPDSKADWARRSHEELDSFREHGDARGLRWLEAHPEDRRRAEQRLSRWSSAQREQSS